MSSNPVGLLRGDPRCPRKPCNLKLSVCYVCFEDLHKFAFIKVISSLGRIATVFISVTQCC